MFRTITNIWGDCCAVTVVEMWARRHDNKLARLAKKADAAKPDVIVGAPPDAPAAAGYPAAPSQVCMCTSGKSSHAMSACVVAQVQHCPLSTWHVPVGFAAA